MTQAERVGLRLEDVPRSSLAKLRRRHRLDAKVRASQGRPTLIRLCRACHRIVVATTTKLLNTKIKAHRRTCRLVGRSTVSIGHL